MSEYDVSLEPSFVEEERNRARQRSARKKGSRQGAENIRENYDVEDPPIRQYPPPSSPSNKDNASTSQKENKGFFTMFKENKILLITTAIVIILFIVFIIWTLKKDKGKQASRPVPQNMVPPPSGPPGQKMGLSGQGNDRDNVPTPSNDSRPDNSVTPPSSGGSTIPAGAPVANRTINPDASHEHIVNTVDDEELNEYINMNASDEDVGGDDGDDGEDGDGNGSDGGSEGEWSDGDDDGDDLDDISDAE